MRLLLIQNMVYAPSHGGANKANRRLLEELAARGHECRAVAPALGSHGAETLEDQRRELAQRGIEVAEAEAGLKLRTAGVTVTALVDRHRLAEVAAGCIEDFAPQLVLVTSEDPGQELLAAASRRAPGRVVYLVHTPLYLPFGPEGYVQSARGTELIRAAAAVITVSHWVRRYIERWSGVRARVLAFPVYPPPPVPRRGSFDSGAVTLVNPCAYKGLPIFLELARRFPETPFLGVETWGTTTEDRRLMARLPNLRLRGAADEIGEIFAETRVLLMPSLFLEAFGLLAVEAMLHGLPVLASASGGLPEAKLGVDYVLPVRTIENYSQRFDEREFPLAAVPPQNLEPWAAALEAVLTDRRRYQELSEQSRRAAAGFVQSVSIDPFEELFEQLISDLAAGTRSALPAEEAETERRSTEITGGEGATAEALKRKLLALRALKAQRRDTGDGGRGGIPRLPREGDPWPVAASFGQERLWFLQQLDPESVAYNLASLVELRGHLDLRLLAKSLNAVVGRHEVLRTVFEERDGQPGQVVFASARLDLPVIDLHRLGTAAEEVAEDLARSWTRRPFDLTRWPLLRLVVCRLRRRQHRLISVFHHIICDGWSAALFLRELVALYRGTEDRLAADPLQYADFAVWQRRQLETGQLEGAPQADRELEYWRGQLAGLETLAVPLKRPGGAPSGRGRRRFFELPQALAAALERVARTSGVSQFMVLLAGWLMVLHRATGQRDLVLGTPVAGRGRSELEAVMGLFVNSLVLRTVLAPDLGFEQVLERVRRTVIEAESHQRLPFERLVQALQPERELEGNPFFQVMFVVEQGVGEIADPGALELEELPLDPGTAMLDLLISLRPVEDGLRGWISFDDGLFGLAAIDRLVDLYRRLLQAAAASPRQPLAALPWVSAPERRQLLEEWAPGPRAAAPEASFTGLFEARAAATPAAVAVVWGQEEISYGQLLRRSAALGAGLAAGLAPRGVGAESLVALLAERGPDLLTAVVGLLRCGAAYLPLDPRHPARRNGEILASAGCAAILCAGELRPALDEALAGVPDPPPVLELEPLVRGGGAAAEPAQTVKAGLETLVYTIFTSGSTGRPKGAMVVRRGMVNHLLAKIRDLGLTAADTVAQTASQCFDISVWQMLAPLVVGGRVVIYPDAVAHDPAQLLRRAAVDGVTVLETVPSLMRLQLDGLPGSEAERPDLSRLRWLIPTGEALPRDLCRRWYRLYPQARLLNAYGPTECSDDVSHYAVPLEDRPEGASVSIGRPVLHTTLHVVDRRGRLLPPGLAGELWVGGRGVGRGYRNEPARTAAVFVPDSFSDSPGARVYRTGDLSRWLDDSNLEFLGRIDHQVKIRGFRIELGEIEHAVRSLPAIQDAVVAVTELGRESRLVAYAVLGTDAGDGRGPGPAELRQALAKQLPEHMVPTHWMMLSELPRLSSGKIDRKALPAAAPILREERYKPPRSFAEELLAGLWEEALGVRRLGVEDNVFDLGAHSLMVTQVRARTERALKVEIPLRRFFEAPTVEQLARLVEQAGAGMTAELEAPPLEPVPRDGDLPLSFSQRRLWFFDRLEPGSAVFNLPTAISLQGELSAAALSGAVTDVMRRHEVLRTRFLEVDGEPLQVLDPWERQTLPVVDLSALPVAERQRQGEALRQREALRPFDLQTGPLLRATLMRRGPSDHEALLTLHHIAADGWSMRLLTEEISAAYAARVTGTTPQLPPLPVQYADYAAWQRKWLDGPALEQELSFWKQYLDGAPDSIDLPLDRPRQPVQRYRGGRLSTWLPATLLGRLRSLSRELRSTLFMTLVTAWQGLLARSSHQTDLVLGTLIANRHRHEVQDLIGFFVNTLVLRTRLPRGRSFRAAVEEVRDTTLEIYAHQDLPFEKLVEELNPDRQLSLTPLFQILFIYQNAPTGEAQLPGLRLSARETARETVNYDLLFALSERDQGIHCQLDFDRDLFDSTTVQRLLGHFRTLVESLVTAPDRPMEKAELWSAAERHQALVEWNDTRREDPLERGGWAQLFADTARRRGDAPAVVCGGESWSYRRLAAQVEDAAKLLAAAGVGEDSVVAVLAPRGLELLVGILAVFR
ncbi:MAG: amino acid adenylation domain-containing protein, partial [Acidobacteriota bacterium]|nr:amino acid adenylation domain-containing protein [Acidobacteriota bacterium]